MATPDENLNESHENTQHPRKVAGQTGTLTTPGTWQPTQTETVMTKVGDGNNAGMQDISREEMSSNQMIIHRGGSADARQKVDGSIETNIWHQEGVSDKVRSKIDGKMFEYKSTVDELRQQADYARANGQPNLADELEFQADTLQKAMDDLKVKYEEFNFDDPLRRSMHASLLNVALHEIDTSNMADIRAIQENAGVDAANNLTPMMVAPDPKPVMGYIMADGDKSVSEMTDDEKGAWVAERLSDPEQLVSDFETNPKEFFADLGHLDSNDRQSIIMTLQTKIQSDNQLYSTLTNFIKAMHDTEKAAISNLRV